MRVAPSLAEVDLQNPLQTDRYPYLRHPRSDSELYATNGLPRPFRTYLVDPAGSAPKPPARILATFKGNVRAVTLHKRETIYRVVGAGSVPAGEFWSRWRPRSERDIREKGAVLSNWNGDRGLVSLQLSVSLLAWSGATAPQVCLDGASFLMGGSEQLWIPRATLRFDSGNWSIGPLDSEEIR
jgi:hypothetical protein